MKKIITCIMLVVMMFGITGCSVKLKNEDAKNGKYEDLAKYYEGDMDNSKREVVKAKVLRIDFDDTQEERPDVQIQSDRRYQHLYVRILNGKHKGEEYALRNTIEMINPYRLVFEKGEKLYIYVFENDDGKVGNIHIYEKVRDKALLWLVIAFLLVLILVGGMNGVKAVVTLTFTVASIAFVVLPLILRGYNPLIVTVGAVSLSATFSLVVISGWNKKTRTAILGTVGGVLVAAIIAWIVGQFAMITGLGDEQANMLALIPQNRHLDFKGILLSGIIIGALGAVMDVALSVASAMWEIEEHSPEISSKKLIKSGMNIGKDVMGSMSNTLILAYVGGSIQLLLLFMCYNISFVEIINMDMIASEVVRAVSGSIGLIAAIPLTTWIGGTIGRRYHANHNKKKSKGK